MASTSRTQHRCRCWAVGCLGTALTAGTGCGFLDGPVHAPATASVVLYTVLRPAEVDVVVSRAATGDVVARGQFPVTYEPFGPKQTQCGGDAHALVVVPVG